MKAKLKRAYAATALRLRMPAWFNSFSLSSIQSSPPGIRLIKYSSQFKNPPRPVRRGARDTEDPMALDCSSCSRSARGFSSTVSNWIAPQISAASVAKVSIKKSAVTIRYFLKFDISQFPDHENADNLGNDGIGQELAADRVGIQDVDILRFQKPESEPDHKRQATKQSSRKSLLRSMRFHLGRHVQALTHQEP